MPPAEPEPDPDRDPECEGNVGVVMLGNFGMLGTLTPQP
jgi:hypothetical protein